MKILCNLPLESFEPRENYPDAEVVTFGPTHRMLVDGVFYPFDIEFDGSDGSVHDLLRALPPGFSPDFLLFYWPDQEPIPSDLEECPIPVVGILSDYNLTLPYVTGLWPFFDTLLVDRNGVDLFRQLSFADTRYFCQYTFKSPTHQIYTDVDRDLDVAFAGNLNPAVQRDRAPWIERLRRLNATGLRTEVRDNVRGEAYGRFLNRAWMGFNRSIRGEMNLRGFEVPACGALLLMEESNLEVRDFLIPDEEVVLYNESNFEEIVCELAGDRSRCQAIAAAGHRRVQEYRMGQRLQEMGKLLSSDGPGKETCTVAERAYGRGNSLLSTWTHPDHLIKALTDACTLALDDPRPLNSLALALIKSSSAALGGRAITTLQGACNLSTSYVPAAYNLAFLLTACGHPHAHRARDQAMERLSADPQWRDLDGPVLPCDFGAERVTHSLSLGEALRQNRPELYVATLQSQLSRHAALI